MSKYEAGQMGSEGECSKEGGKYKKCYRCRLSPLALAVAGGFVCALGTLFLGWTAATHHWGVAMVHLMGSVYTGYAPTMMGGVFGGLWGFADGFISGLIFGWIYNVSLCCCRCRCMCNPK